MEETCRRLPHQYPEGKWLFVTFHLHGSLPHGRYPPPGKLSAGRAFVWMDRCLDTTRTGPMYLAREAIARIVVEVLVRGEAYGQYDLDAYVVMPNHVHVLLLPNVLASRLLRSLKGTTAREANLIVGRTGESFWQAESYDHWVRNLREFDAIRKYIEVNKVNAGLAGQACEFRWSSAHEVRVETSLDPAG